MERKKVTYRVFTIQNASLTHDASDLKDELRTRLAQSNIEHRLIPVNEDDDSINDLLLSPFSKYETDYYCGTCLRCIITHSITTNRNHSEYSVWSHWCAFFSSDEPYYCF